MCLFTLISFIEFLLKCCEQLPKMKLFIFLFKRKWNRKILKDQRKEITKQIKDKKRNQNKINNPAKFSLNVGKIIPNSPIEEIKSPKVMEVNVKPKMKIIRKKILIIDLL